MMCATPIFFGTLVELGLVVDEEAPLRLDGLWDTVEEYGGTDFRGWLTNLIS